MIMEKSLTDAIKDLSERITYVPDANMLIEAIDELNKTLQSIDASIKALTEKLSVK